MERKESLEGDPEVKNIVTVNTIKVEDYIEPMDKVLNHYSDWHRLKRSVAWILKAKKTLWNLKNERKEFSRTVSQTEKDPERQKLKLEQHMKKYKMMTKRKSISLDNLDTAESEIIQFGQRQQFGEEIKVLHKADKSVATVSFSN